VFDYFIHSLYTVMSICEGRRVQRRESDSMLFQTYIYQIVLMLQKAVHTVASALNLPCNSKSHLMCFKTRQSPQTSRCATFLSAQVTRKAKNTRSFDTRHMHARNALRNTR